IETRAWAGAVEAVVGAENVTGGAEAPELAGAPFQPERVAYPTDEAQIGRLLVAAREHGLGVIPLGGGTALDLGFAPERSDFAISTRRLDRVLDYEPADLTVTAEAGITLAALNATLARYGQYLPLEAPLPERATVG